MDDQIIPKNVHIRIKSVVFFNVLQLENGKIRQPIGKPTCEYVTVIPLVIVAQQTVTVRSSLRLKWFTFTGFWNRMRTNWQWPNSV